MVPEYDWRHRSRPDEHADLGGLHLEWDYATITAYGALVAVRTGRVARFGGLHAGYEPSRTLKLHEFDIRTGDRDYWRNAKAFLVWLAQALPAGRRGWAHYAFKQLRRLHHEGKRKEWDDVLPLEIRTWANEQIAKAQAGEFCCDNSRVARLGNTGQMRRYRQQKAHGCCGFADWVDVGPDGNRYALGYNYGH